MFVGSREKSFRILQACCILHIPVVGFQVRSLYASPLYRATRVGRV